jgi:hypothetical protein
LRPHICIAFFRSGELPQVKVSPWIAVCSSSYGNRKVLIRACRLVMA